jgi:tetratricopeptide (TPR) repeat protein
MNRLAGIWLCALVCAMVLLRQSALATHHFISLTNNASYPISSLIVSFPSAAGPVYATDSTPTARHAVAKYTLPHTTKLANGKKVDVSSLCVLDLKITTGDGNSYWLRGHDLCAYPYIDARDGVAYAYSSYAYATPIPSTPEPSPTPESLAEQEVDRGGELFKRGQYAGSMLFFNRAVKLDPSDPFALAYRGRTYFLLDQFDKSLSDLDHGLQLDPKEGLLFWLRGLTLWAMGVYGSAASDFHSAALNGAPVDYLSLLEALADRDNGREADARAVLLSCKKLCTKRPPYADYNKYLLGELSAPALLLRAKTREEKDEAHAMIGLTLLQHGNAAAAQPHLRWVLHNAEPGDNWPPILRQHLRRPR